MKNNIALFVRENLLAIIALNVENNGSFVLRLDPRIGRPEIAVCDNNEKAKEVFSESVQTSKDNGWRMVHIGKPNWG